MQAFNAVTKPVTAAYTVSDDDQIIEASGTFTVTLPGASGNPGRVFTVVNTGTGIITVAVGGTSGTINGSSTVFLMPNHSIEVTSGSGSSNNYRGLAEFAPGRTFYSEIALTNAEIKALRATPKTLVAAPGAGKFLEFVGAVLLLDYGTNVLTESADNLAVKLGDGSGTQVSQDIEATGFIDQSADTMTNALPKLDTIVSKTAGENKALVLHNTGDGEYAGNAGANTLMRVKVSYRVHLTGF